MPSLSALQEFKSSFGDIGNEKAILAERGIPFDDMELPDTEAEPMDLGGGGPAIAPDVAAAMGLDSGGAAGAFDLDDLGSLGIDSEMPAVQAAAESPAGEFGAGGDFDFGDLLGAIPDDTPPSADDVLAGLDMPDSAAPAETAGPGAADDFGIPDGLLDGLASELETAAPDSEGESLDLGGETAGAGEEPFDISDFDIPDASAESVMETPDGDLDLGEENLDLGGENVDLGGETTGSGEEPFDISDFDASAGGASDETSPFETQTDGADFDLGDDVFGPAGEADTAAGDAFDAFSFDGEQPGADFDAGTGADASPGTEEFDADFSLPGIDDLLEKPVKGAKAAAAPKAKGKARAKAKQEEALEEVEEIQLSDEDIKQFQKTLSGYPLNLRIACEELIVEQAVAPDQMSRLIRLLVTGAPAKETAVLAGQILGRTIEIPKGFEKSTGEALEEEQASFAYIFVHNFLPILRLFALVAVGLVSLAYLAYTFIYTPLKAESIYKIGYERIFAGEYERANERFTEAFNIQRKKDWFYRYAEAFRDERQFMKAEEKYDELLRYYPRDKKGVLDYAALETHYLFNYQKANNLLQRELLDYAPNDFEGLLAYGDNNLAWGEIDPAKYEDARFAYARLLDKYGWTGPVVERMMKYFIRTDKLGDVLHLQAWFMNNPKQKLAAASLAELGGYLLDKRLEEVRGVPNEYVERIEGIRDLLLAAVQADPYLPEAHYHLARYYQSLGNTRDERVTLEMAIRTFDNAKEESVRRLIYRIDAHQRYADALINSREFKPAEEQLVKGINLYEDALGRRLISRSPDYGRLYAGLGDLEYFTKTGDMEMALNYYRRSEQNGWAPPEMQYRMGAAYYQLEDWRNALEYLFTASSSLPLNRRVLFALGNSALKRGDYFAAQGYYNRLLDILEAQRARLPVLLPNDRPEYLELAERLMMARNNAGVAYEALANQTGDRRYRTRAQVLYTEANRAWDARTRDPRTMIRSGSIPLPYLNSRNTLYPQTDYEPQIFIRIDRDALEPSKWEELAPIIGLE
jgi:tetratricopeptide (TPR) repeat protein